MVIDIGKTLVGQGVVTPSQLRQALRFQDDHPHMPIGSVVVLLRLASAQDVEKAVLSLEIFRGDKKPTHAEMMELVESLASRSRELTLAFELLSQMLAQTR
jgi:hypothetical protein